MISWLCLEKQKWGHYNNKKKNLIQKPIFMTILLDHKVTKFKILPELINNNIYRVIFYFIDFEFFFF